MLAAAFQGPGQMEVTIEQLQKQVASQADQVKALQNRATLCGHPILPSFQ